MAQEISFGELFRRYRKAYKYNCTQAEIAERIGYSKETIGSWESGRRFPARDEIPRLAQWMGLGAEEVERAIEIGHRLGRPGKIVLESKALSSAQVEPSPFLLTSYHSNYGLALFEDELLTRWEVYRTGGSLLASRGLAGWADAIEVVARETKESKDRNRAMNILNVTYQLGGSIYSDLMLYSQAHAAYRKAFCIARDQQDYELMAAALARRGVAYIQQGKPARAVSYLNHAAALANDLPVIHLKCYLFKALAEAHATISQFNESSRAIDIAEHVLERAGEGLERSYCQVSAVSVLAQKGVDAVALECYQDAIVLIDRSLKTYHPAYIRGRARLIAQKAEALYGLKQVGECIEVAEEASKLANAIGSRKTVERLQKLYLVLVKSRWRKEKGVERLGAFLAM